MIASIYPGRFYRSWVIDLAPAWCAFANDGHTNMQVQLTKRWDKLPLACDHMRNVEQGLPGGAP